MGLAEDLRSLTVARLKKEVAAANIKGYSKMKKDELIKLMVKNAEKFQHLISSADKKTKKKTTKKEKPVKSEEKMWWEEKKSKKDIDAQFDKLFG